MKFSFNVYQKRVINTNGLYGIMPITFFDTKLHDTSLFKFITSKKKIRVKQTSIQSKTYYTYSFNVPLKQLIKCHKEYTTLQDKLNRFFFITRKKLPLNTLN